MTRESIFIKKEVDERERTVAEIVGIWRKRAESYRNVLDDYNELLEEKKQLNLSIRGVRKQTLRDFREIEIFNIEAEDKVMEHLENMEVASLKNVLKAMNNALESYEYKTLTSTISIFRDEIYQAKQKKRRMVALGRC